MFLKNSFIDFEKLIIEKYSFLGLDEVELIILIKMNKSISLNEKFSIDKLVKTMNANEDVVRNKIVDLINNQFITLQLKGNKEIYSLDDTYKRLAELLEKEDVVETKEENQSDIHKIILLLEKEFKKMLSPLELELVHKWINDDKFSYEKIYNAVLETLKLK
jgi:DNA replication protein